MSLNNILTCVRHVFTGKLRLLWVACAAACIYLLWSTLAGALLTWGFARLFDAWGVNTLNLYLAPAWVRAVVDIYPYAVSLLVSIPIIAVFSLITRRFSGRNISGVSEAACHDFSDKSIGSISGRNIGGFSGSSASVRAGNSPDAGSSVLKDAPSSPISRISGVSVGFVLGCLAIIVPYVLFILADSMRIEPSSPRFHWAIMANLPVCIASAWAEHLVSRRLIVGAVKNSVRPLPAYALSAALVVVMTRPWRYGVTAIPNTALLGVFLCMLTCRRASSFTIALRAGWMWASSSLIGVTGAEIALISIYPVSESVLTGGASGILNGLFMSCILLAAILISHRKALMKLISDIRIKRSGVKARRAHNSGSKA